MTTRPNSPHNPHTAGTIRTPAATLTNAATIAYTVSFSESVTGLQASDFARTGTATGCTIGAPNDEWGEEVRAVIQLKATHAPSEALKAEILGYAQASLAKFKVPRALDFVPELPRSAAGKVLRGKVREPYWAGRARQI